MIAVIDPGPAITGKPKGTNPVVTSSPFSAKILLCIASQPNLKKRSPPEICRAYLSRPNTSNRRLPRKTVTSRTDKANMIPCFMTISL